MNDITVEHGTLLAHLLEVVSPGRLCPAQCFPGGLPPAPPKGWETGKFHQGSCAGDLQGGRVVEVAVQA